MRPCSSPPPSLRFARPPPLLPTAQCDHVVLLIFQQRPLSLFLSLSLIFSFSCFMVHSFFFHAALIFSVPVLHHFSFIHYFTSNFCLLSLGSFISSFLCDTHPFSPSMSFLFYLFSFHLFSSLKASLCQSLTPSVSVSLVLSCLFLMA